MRTRPWLGTLARLVLGAVFLWAGLSKVTDLTASEQAVAAYQFVPYDVARAVGATLPFVEVVLGLLLVVGLATRAAAAMSAVLLTVFIVAIISVWARRLSIDCGCFGGGGAVADGAALGYLRAILRDTALLGLAAVLAWRPESRFGLDRGYWPSRRRERCRRQTRRSGTWCCGGSAAGGR